MRNDSVKTAATTNHVVEWEGNKHGQTARAAQDARVREPAWLQRPSTMKGLLIPILLSGFCQAVRVYLHPAPSFPPRLSASHAGAALSSHLSLERFEDATSYSTGQELLVGSGLDTGLLLIMSEEDAKGTSRLLSMPGPRI